MDSETIHLSAGGDGYQFFLLMKQKNIDRKEEREERKKEGNKGGKEGREGGRDLWGIC